MENNSNFIILHVPLVDSVIQASAVYCGFIEKIRGLLNYAGESMALETLIIEPTKKTPWIIFEPGRILIAGRSISENPAEFYKPLHEWVAKYADESTRMTNIQLGFEFINTTSIKWLYAILKELGRIPDMTTRAKISWYYEEGDEDMCDLGFILRSLVPCPFHITEVDDINKQKF